MASDPVASVLTRAQRRRLALVIVVSQLVLALVTATAVYGVWQRLNGNIEPGGSIPSMSGGPAVESGPQQPLNILVLGTDARDGAGDAIDGEAGCDCSDTTILVHVAADRQSAYGISIPRDALVAPVACTEDHLYYGPGGAPTGLVEWNAAYSVGKAPCTAQQVQDDFGVPVDGYVVIDFQGFKQMVDAIDGVDVCIPFELYDPKYAHADFKPGPAVHLDGTDALKYVRLRHAYDPVTGDYTLDGTDPGRIKRQQAFISAMIDKLFSESTLTRPDRLLSFATALTGSITTNPELAHVSKLVDLGEQLKDIDLQHIRFVSLPSRNYGPGAEENRVEVLPAAYQLMKRVARDQPLGRFAKGARSAGGHHGRSATKDADAAVGVCS